MSALMMASPERSPTLAIGAGLEQNPSGPIGRARECAVLDQLAIDLMVGRSHVLVLQGDEGVGKTVLLDYLAERAAACHLVRTAGVETEKDLCLAALQQLCGPLLTSCEALPDPQREVLETAFGLQVGVPPDKFVVGMAMLALLTTMAAEKPLLCIVNNFQWIDEASKQVLGFVARRLSNAPVAIVMATTEDDAPAIAGIAVLTVSGLADDDARTLLGGSVFASMDVNVQERIAAEARGNPATLKLMAAGLSLDSVAGGYGPPLGRVPRRMERAFRRRLAALSPTTRRLLLLAAVEPTGDASILWQAAQQLGISHGAATAAVSARLVEFDESVRFCHPLLRSVIHDSATPYERRIAHRALAAATDDQTDPDRRAWHRGQAAADVDEDAALDLERTAHRARERGGLPAKAAFHTRAAELTDDLTRRSQRALLAAELKYRAGSSREARRLLAMAQAGPLQEPERARAQFLAARLSVHTRRGVHAPRLMLDAAHACRAAQADVALIAYGEALRMALTRFGAGCVRPQDIALALHGPDDVRAPGFSTSMLRPAAILIGHGPAAGAHLVKQALDEFCGDESPVTDDDLSWALLACGLAQELWDDASWLCVSDDLVGAARRSGSLAVLSEALNAASVLTLLRSGTAAAAPLIDEAEAIGRATESQLAPHSRLLHWALQGRIGDVSALISEARPTALSLGENLWVTAADLASAVVNNGGGQYHEAMRAAERGARSSDGTLAAWCVSEFVEAAVRAGADARAERWLDKLSRRAEGCATNWALGLSARATALVVDDSSTEERYLEAVCRFERTHVRHELARTRLLYGEWLRRAGRRVDAREQLGTAHELFTGLGSDGFAERARRELVSTGATPRLRTQTTVDVLTAQEAQIARLARDGRSNSEIGVELYLSHRTVEWHLRKVFVKLGITSRRQLEKALPG